MYPFWAAAPPCLYKTRASSCKSRSFCFKVASLKNLQLSIRFITSRIKCVSGGSRGNFLICTSLRENMPSRPFPAALLLITGAMQEALPDFICYSSGDNVRDVHFIYTHLFPFPHSLKYRSDEEIERLGNYSAARDLHGYRLIHAQNISWKERNSSTASQTRTELPPSSNWLKDTRQIYAYGIIPEGERRTRLS